MPVVPILLVASLATQGYSMVQQNKANKASAALAKSTATYNAGVDTTEARQLEFDAEANTIAMRREAAIYTSRQKAAYASSGVLNTGSALAVEAETAGALEQRIQQERNNALRGAQQKDSSAAATIRYGAATADAYRTKNTIDMLRGGIGILQTVGGAYMSGIGTSGGSSAASGVGAGMATAFHY